MNIPVTYEDIELAYDELTSTIEDAFRIQVEINDLDSEKADLWAGLLEIDGFKPGRSNMEQAAKLRAYFPDFMEKYEARQQHLESIKVDVEVVKLNVQKLKTLLELGRILAALKEDE